MNRAIVNFPTADNLCDSTNTALAADAPLSQRVIAVLRKIYDPELPVNIYDLGLIYAIDIQGRDVTIEMTLTSPNCPVAGSLPAAVETRLKQIDDIGEVSVKLTWDPPWHMDRLTDEVKLALGLL